MSLNRDSLVAIVLVLISGGLMAASFDISEPNYGQLSPAAWPRAVIAGLGLLSVIYLIQSLRQGPDAPREKRTDDLSMWEQWQNVVWVFLFFLLYLLAIPFVGMLIGGMCFVFLLLTALGGIRQALLHGAIAVLSVGLVWAAFTYALGVNLPRGDWTGF